MNKKTPNTYKRRAGTSGIQGHLYETKLISLIYFRMIHDDNIDQFSLASNIDDVGAFDDICFKAKIKGFEKPVAVFIQAKHRENIKYDLTFTKETELAKYFHSYLEIRRSFEPIFGGNFDESECFFVMYTTLKDDQNNKIYEGSLADYLNKLIGTGGSRTQPSYTDESLDFICKIVMKQEITTLATQLAKFICDESDSVMSMNNDLIMRYHVILALNVVNVSEIQPEGHRIASFRQDFFTTNDEYILLFKNILLKHIKTLCLTCGVLKKRKLEETDVLHSLLLKFFSEPSEVTTLSKLIGSVLTYKNSKLESVGKLLMTDDQKRQLDEANVSQSTVYEAAELAAKEYLESLELKVPAFFGNKDLAIRGKPEKIEKRLNYLTSKIIEKIEQSNPNNIVTIDESLGDGFLKLNGGVASAVGNILVFDKESKMLKFTDNCESLGNLARTWYASLKSKIENLDKYKLDVKLENFPKLSFERGGYDVSLVRDFYDKLLFYTNQADQNGVEEILRAEIKKYPCNDVKNFRVRSDVIFLKYHNEIQTLWMMPIEGSYLTKERNIYEKAVTDALSEPLMGVLNIMHKIKYKDYTFNENALKPFESYGQIIGTVIATGNCELTVAKVEQYLGNKDRVVLDLENIFNLSLKNHNTLCKELKNTTEENILIIVCHNSPDSRNSVLENIVKAVEGKQIIIITNENSVAIMTQYFSQATNVLKDEKSVFTDLSAESMKKLLATSKIKVQGEVIRLDIIGDDESVQLIDEDVFDKLINNETIEIGDTPFYNNYEKQFYIDRRVSRNKKQKHVEFVDVKDKVLKTFYDLDDRVVLITGELGMGKSTLLNHLSLKTKELHPEVWILRINIQEHEEMVRILNDEDTYLDTSKFFNFICQVVLGEEYDKRQKEDWRQAKTKELVNPLNNAVLQIKFLGGKSKEFQLKMFLYYFYKGKLIFLFDGLDEIKISSMWQFQTAVLSLQSLVERLSPNKVWITSRSMNIIEQELGPSYQLENFSRLEQDTYLITLWKSNIQLKSLHFKEMLECGYFAHTYQYYFLRKKIDLRGYALFLDFIQMESSAAGIDFPYDECYGKYYDNHKKILHDSNILCFPDDTMPWDLSALAQRFIQNFENMRDRFYPDWRLHQAIREGNI